MNVALRRGMTVDEFIAWDDRQELRYEFDGLAVHAMTGGTDRHAAIQSNVIRVLGNRLLGSSCRVFGSHLKVALAHSVRYPDAFVACGPLNGDSVRRDPVVVFEILSPGTAELDRTVKNAEYRAAPSIMRYVMLEQDRIAATMFERAGDDWVGHLLAHAEASLAMTEISVELQLGEFYADVPPL